MLRKPFRNSLGQHVFGHRYANYPDQPWSDKADLLVTDVVYGAEKILKYPIAATIKTAIRSAINSMAFIPGGRYVYYAGREASFYNNCYLFGSKEDTKEEWATLTNDVTSALMTGGGIGDDYSVFRPAGSPLARTGGWASGPIPLMCMVNEIGRNVMQGGSRRAALYASLNWQHGDVGTFLTYKNWDEQYIPGTDITVAQAKEADFNYPAPLDMTNISLNYDNEFLEQVYDLPFEVLLQIYKDGGKQAIFQLPVVNLPETFIKNTEQAMRNGEPGFSFNFFEQVHETLRNACTEVTSETDGDVCNLGSINLSRVDTLEDFCNHVENATIFLLCGTVVATLPSEKIEGVREQNRRLGLGLMGVHEWLLKRGYRYECVSELREWLKVYQEVSDTTAREWAEKLGLSRPKAVRAIAPTGTIGTMAGTTTGIEPIYAVAYKRRYIVNGNEYKFEYCIDSTAKTILDATPELSPSDIETASELACDPERRIAFQADVQDYVDMAISSTLNLPEWGSEYNNPGKVNSFAEIVAKYAVRLRGLTMYPDGSRGGQPIVEVPYEDAVGKEGIVFEDNDSCKGGLCGI